MLHGISEPMLKSGSHVRRSSMNTLPAAPVPLKLQDYQMGPCIGQGSSALVFMAKHGRSQMDVSIKVIDLDMFERNQIDELRVLS